MIKHEVWHEIHTRFKLKEGKKSIAWSLGLSVQTVRKVVREQAPTTYKRSHSDGGVLAAFENFIQTRLAAVGYCAQAIDEELKEEGYQGSYETVKLYVRPFREEARSTATMRFETPPGRQAQGTGGNAGRRSPETESRATSLS